MKRFPSVLRQGYQDFMAGRFWSEKQRYEDLAIEGQSPRILVVACCDSRAAPETVFNAGPGEIFVVRNVANLVPPYQPDGNYHATSAALEFALQALKVEHIVVMGHGRCGGIHAALSPANEPLSGGDFIGKWMNMLKPVAETISSNTYLTESERQTALERMSIRNSINNLRTFPEVQALEADGKVQLHGAWFDISTGELWVMDGQTGDFGSVDRIPTD
ncbi:MAG: carbonic anhydrase [Ahrensia sp.]